MKRVLFIAPSSFPVNDAESIVNIKLLKTMASSGQFIIDIISKKNKNIDYPTNTLQELGIDINSINIVEVDNSITLKTIWLHIKSLFIFGTVFKGSHWAVEALSVAKMLYKKYKYDYVLTKNGAAPLVGFYLKRKYGAKLVSTWNDPYPVFTYPKIYSDFYKAKKSFFEIRMLHLMKKYVDIHIFPSSWLRNHMLSYIGIDKSQTIIIPHVVIDVHDGNYGNINHEKLKIIHSGNLKYPRDPEVFLSGLRLFLNDDPKANIEVTILGVADDSLKEKISKYNLHDYVTFHSPVPYNDSLSLLANYHVACIIEAKCMPGIFLPTKVSDFMQEGKSIFAISPSKGVLSDLYSNGNIKYFADNTDDIEVSKVLKQIYLDFLSNKIAPSIIPQDYTQQSVVKKYLSF